MATAIVAAVGIAVGVGTTIYGASQKKKAERKMNRLRREAGDIQNPYENLQPSTIGASFQGAQALRSEASQLNILSRSGSRGLAFTPQISRNTALINQGISTKLDEQSKRIQQLKAGGEIFKTQMEEARMNLQSAGFANLYATGEANIGGGINLATSSLASGFSQGGAFTNRPNNQLLRQPANNAIPSPTVGMFQPQANIPLSIPQSLVSN